MMSETRKKEEKTEVKVKRDPEVTIKRTRSE